MKTNIIYLLFIFLISCNSYEEYMMGAKAVTYSNDANLKRYTLDAALRNPEKVQFLDVRVSIKDDTDALLKQLNDNIQQFVNLKKLTILGLSNKKNFFPKNIFKLKGIEFLAISNFNELDVYDLIGLMDLKELKYLALTRCGLTELPSVILHLTALQALDLEINNLTDLPKDIGQLQELQTIDLTNNCFKNIPESLLGCVQLQWINMSNSEGNDLLESMGWCINECNNVALIEQFKSLKGIDLSWVFETPHNKALDAKYVDVKVK